MTMTDQNLYPPPVCNSGGAWVGWIDDGETYATITFQGSTSYPVDPDSVSPLTHNWQFGPSAVPPTSAAADPTAQMPPGLTYVHHTVTDVDNGKSTRQVVPVYVHMPDEDPPYDCLVEALDGDEDNGWSITVRVFDPLGLDALPDGGLVVFWVEEIIAGTKQSLGNKVPGRSHVKFVGYVRSDENNLEPGTQRLTFEAQSVFTVLQDLFAFSRVLVESASPDAWSAIRGLTVKRAIIQLLRYYTTALDLYDLDFDNFGDSDYPQFFLQRQNVIEQVKDLAASRAARFVCDRTGRLMVQTIPQMYPLDQRHLLTTTLTLAADDLIRVRFVRSHFRPVSTLEMRGFNAADAYHPIFSKWAGSAPADGPQYPIVERMIADSQPWLNLIAGMRGAYIEGILMDEDGVYRQLSSLDVEVFGSYDVLDFYAEWSKVNLDAFSNRRGIDLNDWRFTLQSVSITYQDGTARTSLVFRPETGAIPGETYTPPGADTNGLPSDLTDPSDYGTPYDETYETGSEAPPESGIEFPYLDDFTDAPGIWSTIITGIYHGSFGHSAPGCAYANTSSLPPDGTQAKVRIDFPVPYASSITGVRFWGYESAGSSSSYSISFYDSDLLPITSWSGSGAVGDWLQIAPSQPPVANVRRIEIAVSPSGVGGIVAIDEVEIDGE
jgi:hypothetical protein